VQACQGAPELLLVSGGTVALLDPGGHEQVAIEQDHVGHRGAGGYLAQPA
jgi:hypothetical protein